MRFIYLLILLVFVAAVGVFAVQNNDTLTLRYFDRTVTGPLSVVIGGAYLIGMLSGWTVVGLLKRSVQRVTERRAE
jgi:uncharacterized integral membrane protein